MNIKLTTPFGRVAVKLENAQLVAVKAETDLGAFYGQGYAAGKLRLWQIDLTRRLASGRLSEIMGPSSLRADLFQRKMGLSGLAERESRRISDLKTQKTFTDIDQADLKQEGWIEAYITGVNEAMKKHMRPTECFVLGYRPEPLTNLDVYQAALLKYFINSAWQYEFFFTKLSGRLSVRQMSQLFATFPVEGGCEPPWPLEVDGRLTDETITALRDGLEGLKLIGLSSPDTGSNVFAVNGRLTKDGYPLLAADPHMGQVNPGFSLLCRLESEEGLWAAGAHFPGVPGLVVGRNREAAWGMVGIMADNQDLFFGELDAVKGLVKLDSGWVPLKRDDHAMTCRGGRKIETETYGFEGGRLIRKVGDFGLFLRWPALDAPLGDIVLYDLMTCRDWKSFRKGLSRLYNAPMMAGYADSHGDIGLQAAGLFPKRKAPLGALLQKIDEPRSAWQGYVPFEELPSLHNPPEGYVIYANQYSKKLFEGRPSLSNRWHPPSRALRIEEMILSGKQHDAAFFMKIQDDRLDVFAREELPYLRTFLPSASPLQSWNGDTQETASALLFEAFMRRLASEILAGALGPMTLGLYLDFCPSGRWSVMNILKNNLSDWPQGANGAAVSGLIETAYQKAVIEKIIKPECQWRHSFKKDFWMKLFTAKMPYDGGNRETIHATRQSGDFLTGSHSAGKNNGEKPFIFGPAFKFVNELAPGGNFYFTTNTPARGRPFFWSLSSVLKNWVKGRRCKLAVPLPAD